MDHEHCPHDAKIEQMFRTVEKLDLHLTGGKCPERGLLVKVDRLETFTGQLRWILGVIAVAAVGVFVIALASVLGIGGP